MAEQKNKFIAAGAASRRIGVTPLTLSRYARAGKIEHVTTPGGRFLYNVDKFLREYGDAENPNKDNKVFVCYCRVSTHGQVDDLQRQVNYMTAKYPDYEIITDIGSGINFKRKGLQKIIDYAISGKLEKLVVAYKDRLCRIGFDMIEHILTKYSNTQIIIDHQIEETINEEIANDILQIITVYSAKVNGMRSYKKKEIDE